MFFVLALPPRAHRAAPAASRELRATTWRGSAPAALWRAGKPVKTPPPKPSPTPLPDPSASGVRRPRERSARTTRGAAIRTLAERRRPRRNSPRPSTRPLPFQQSRRPLRADLPQGPGLPGGRAELRCPRSSRPTRSPTPGTWTRAPCACCAVADHAAEDPVRARELLLLGHCSGQRERARSRARGIRAHRPRPTCLGSPDRVAIELGNESAAAPSNSPWPERPRARARRWWRARPFVRRGGRGPGLSRYRLGCRSDQ